MKWLYSFLFVIIVVISSLHIGKIPAIGMFLNPFTGFAQNAQNATLKKEIILKTSALGGPSQVIYDSSYVPHIFTKHDSDLYFLQGYVLAKDRLWQMEMQSRSGMGELSEIAGPVALENDRLMRRLGIYDAAQTLLKQFEEDGTISVVHRYTQGVNAYIESLSDKDLPIEYKLMGFKPRKYEPIHTAILLKIMAMRLTAMEADIENTNFANTFGKALFDELYPNFYKYQQPICSEIQKMNTSSDLNKNEVQFITKNCFSKRVLEHFDRSLGSNNWAVSASKSASGNAMLANDPHLKIHLPAIWYEMHLVSDEQNVYGATMPGAPGIVIGFNNNIAWGVTNAGRDVRNWYDVQFKKGSKSEIVVDSGFENVTLKTHIIQVKGAPQFIDSQYITSFGRVIYDDKFSKETYPKFLALDWTNYLPSNELKTFLKLNKAKNKTDYYEALKTFYCPGQNFVYADLEGNVAIKQQGLFPKTAVDYDKFVLDGTKKQNKVTEYIPIDENPTEFNPKRGFVTSANQHPTDASYPYYYSSGDFEAYRNRRIFEVLSSKEKLSIEDMKKLQGDNFNKMAQEFLPLFLKNIKPLSSFSAKDQNYLMQLQRWNFYNEAESNAATLFELWIKSYEKLVWDELEDSTKLFDFPKTIVLYELTLNNPNHAFFDLKTTQEKESAKEMIQLALEKALSQFKNEPWWEFKATEIPHLAMIPAFGHYNIKTGGNKHIVNAIWKDWAPSWRMIVEMKPQRPEAYICYPGGQSGNPASFFYDQQIPDWQNTRYRKVILTFKPQEVDGIQTIYINP